jgi:hypothetical protein
MVSQYPYTLYVLTTTAVTFDSNGNAVKGTTSWVEWGKCRDEANSKGQTINLVDGKASVFDSLIQAPRNISGLIPGLKVEVKDKAGSLRLSGTVKRFQKDQMHCRIWV